MGDAESEGGGRPTRGGPPGYLSSFHAGLSPFPKQDAEKENFLRVEGAGLGARWRPRRQGSRGHSSHSTPGLPGHEEAPPESKPSGARIEALVLWDAGVSPGTGQGRDVLDLLSCYHLCEFISVGVRSFCL